MKKINKNTKYLGQISKKSMAIHNGPPYTWKIWFFVIHDTIPTALLKSSLSAKFLLVCNNFLFHCVQSERNSQGLKFLSRVSQLVY